MLFYVRWTLSWAYRKVHVCCKDTSKWWMLLLLPFFRWPKTMTFNKNPNTNDGVWKNTDTLSLGAVEIFPQKRNAWFNPNIRWCNFIVLAPRKWENKKHSQTNWCHHIIPFKSQTYSIFSVLVFLQLSLGSFFFFFFFCVGPSLSTLFGKPNGKAHKRSPQLK